MGLSLSEATMAAMRGLAWAGSTRGNAVSRKYAVNTAAVSIPLPLNATDQRPGLMRFSIPSGAIVYASFNGREAVVPTTSDDGSARIHDGDVVATYGGGGNVMSVIAEAAATITISYAWD